MANNRQLQVDVILNDSSFRSGVQRMVSDLRNVDNASRSVSKSSNIMTQGFKGAVGAMMGIGAAVAGIQLVEKAFAGVVKTGMEYTRQMSKVEAISGSSSLQMAELGANARQLGADTQWSATNVAEAYEYMALAGWSASEQIAASKPLLDLATAGALDLAKASDIVTDTMTPFGMSADRAGEAADAFAVAQSTANLNVEQLGETMKYAAPVANAFGMNLNETSAIAMIFANSGIKASMAGTALRAGLSRLASPPKAAAKALDELGVSTVKADGNMKSMHDIIAEMSPAFLKLSESQQIASAKAIFGEEAYAGWMEVLKGGVEQFDTFNEKLDSSAGAAEVAAKIMANNLTGAMDNLSSQTENLGLVLFSSLEPSLVGAAMGATGLVDAMTKLIDPSGRAVEASKYMQAEQQKLATTQLVLANQLNQGKITQEQYNQKMFEANQAYDKNLTSSGMMEQKQKELDAALKAGTITQEQYNQKMNEAQIETGKLEQGIQQVTEKQNAFSDSFAGISQAYQMMATEDTKFQTAQQALKQQFEEGKISVGQYEEGMRKAQEAHDANLTSAGMLKQKQAELKQAVDEGKISQEQANQILEESKAKYDAMEQNINRVKDSQQMLGEAFNAVKEVFSSVWEHVQPIVSEMAQFIGEKFGEIKQFISENSENIKAIWEALWFAIELIIIPIWEAIKNIIDGALNIIMGIVKAFGSLLRGDFSGMWEGIKQIFQGAVELIWGLINLYFIGRIGQAFKVFGTATKSFFTGFWNGIKAIWTSSIEMLSQGAKNGFKGMIDGIKGIVSMLKDIISNAWDNAVSFLKGIDLIDIGKKIIGTLIDGIKSMFGAVGNAIGTISEKIQGAFSGRSITVEGNVKGEKISAKPMLRGVSPVRAMFAMDSPMSMVAAPALVNGSIPSNNFRSAQSPISMALSNTLSPLANLNRDLSSSINKSSGISSKRASSIPRKQAPIQLEIPVTIDGKEVARATAIYTNNELAIQNRRFNLAKGVRF
ncbi:phage tail tape measure protein [Bacillus thuringiensis]